MSAIKMTFEDVRTKSSQYGEASAEIQAMIQKLNGYQEELRGAWEGSAFTQFDNRYEDLKPQIQNFENLLMNISEFLDKAAGTLEEADLAIKSSIDY